MFNNGKCWGYGNTPVRASGVCDSWDKEKRERYITELGKVASGPIQNGGHQIENYLGSGKSFTTIPWEKGYRGKGFYYDGVLHLWRTDDNFPKGPEDPDPHHDGIYDSLVREPFEKDEALDYKRHYAPYMQAPKFYIEPNGQIAGMRFKNQELDRELERELASRHPDLRPSPQTEQWSFE
jgi:hypothetical protein